MIVRLNSMMILHRISGKLSLLLTAAFLSIFLSTMPSAGFVLAASQSALTANVEGQVTDKQTGTPVQGAQVNALALGLSATTDISGRFAWRDIPMTQTIYPATITIIAEGYGDWIIQDVRIIADEKLILKAELRETSTRIVVPPPSSDRPRFPDAQLARALLDPLEEDQSELPLPNVIRVRVTGEPHCDFDLPYTVEIINFKEYVKHVLPNEWSPAWPWESLRSGAMAAKMYAWSIIAAGGKWSDADVYDSTCDQVYNPAVEYESTNISVDFTWNWRLMRDDQLIRTFYRAYYSQCPEDLTGNCMGQIESRDMANDGHTWDEILLHFYDNGAFSEVWDPPGGYSLRYYGMYGDDENRVKIAIDDPNNSDPGPPADIGAEDFTIEWWMKADSSENTAGTIECGANQNWRHGNILVDRDRRNQDRKFGVSLADGRLVFGVSGDQTGDLTLCANTDVTDTEWHHIAVQRRRSDGWMWIFIDGILEAEADGPDGDTSYPDDGVPGDFCGPSGDQPCIDSDPFLVIGAEKHNIDHTIYPSFSGWIDEIRLSNSLRYSTDFSPPADPFIPDSNTTALYHFDEGVGNNIHDSSGYSGGPSDGVRIYGGEINGPEWTDDTRWYVPPPAIIPSFTDVPESFWAFQWIEALYDSGITAGCNLYPPMFCPEATATRYQMAVFLERGMRGSGYSPPTASGTVFDDVPASHWAAAWIEQLAADGITGGCSTDPPLYCPVSSITRAQMAIFLERAMHWPTPYTPPPASGTVFDDVPASHWAAAWIEQLAADGITGGCSSNPPLYCPESPVTRAHMAVFLVRAFNLPMP